MSLNLIVSLCSMIYYVYDILNGMVYAYKQEQTDRFVE